MSNVKIKEVTYKLHEKCLQISNEEVDLIVTTQEGPRIIRYGFSGQRNQFCDDAPLTLDVKGEKWRLMGGHRLWHSPEKFPRTYMPDNKPVDYKKTDNGVIVYQKADAPIKRLGAKQCTLPFNIGLENAVVPQEQDIINAVKSVLYSE